ncbi:hypothetical protein Plim_2167 [Planctopirus limnophila DSM 3776]|uniref:Uncharacterized protein n=1 Tax=Planctopirus limnophila (strain ATCC 43296 / DSM 3776 / IFAM 1008 / Mu 290) TaxID=521674 RepID=D5SMT8_PLAL2|nr:hypothetical protein Plim_2167 [Planctopirus limnophila DSM 3776]
MKTLTQKELRILASLKKAMLFGAVISGIAVISQTTVVMHERVGLLKMTPILAHHGNYMGGGTSQISILDFPN